MLKLDAEKDTIQATYQTASIGNFKDRTGVSEDQKSYWYKDSAIVRYTPARHGATQVINDLGLMALFLTRAHDEKWKTIQSVQTTVKNKMGCGLPVIVNFYATMNPDDIHQPISYEYKSFGDDLDLMDSDKEKYCIKQVHKMCFYIATVHQIEILRMKCEFLTDEHQTVWFTHARDIHSRLIQVHFDHSKG
jgi:hypothetical protein